MKKLLVSALAIAGLVACSQEQTLVSKSPASMEFGVASLDKATRVDPSLTTDNLEGFNVWAWMDDESGNVLTAEDVEKVGGVWSYFNTAYWMPGHNYSFAAVAPMDSANWTYNLNATDNGEDNTINFKNVDGTEDLIYAVAERSTVNDAVGQDYDAVELRFNHLLSKTKFTFKNGFATDNVTVQVTDVKMTAFAEATYAGGKWGEATGATAEPLAYGSTAVMEVGEPSVVADERLIIPAPATASYEITYTIQVWYGKKPGFEGGLTKTTTLTGWEFVQGKAYNFVAEITPESLNLDEIEFTVKVDTWDEQDVNCGEIDEAFTFVTSAAEIQSILDKATDDVTILFGNDIKGDVTVLQKKGVNVTINGNGNKFDGVLTVNGDGRANGEETLTITDINFETTHATDTKESEWTFISAPSKINGKYNYSHNVTIENCTFRNTVDGVKRVGSASFTGTYNFVMRNCEAYNQHSLLQTQSVDNNVLVENVKAIDCKSGVSFGNTAYPTLRNAEIEAAEYGVRADGNASRGKLFIENSTIEAKQPVVVRKVTTAGYTVNVDEASVLNTAEAYHVIFTKGSDDAAYEAPVVDFTFNGSSKYVVFPYVQNAVVVTTEAELTDAVKNAVAGDAVVVAEGTYGKFPSVGNKNLTIICHDVVFEGLSKLNIGGSTVVGATFSNPSGNAVDQTINGVFKECTFTGSNALRYAYVGETCVFENCVFDGSVYGIHFDGGTNKEVTFRNCTISGFNGLGAAISMATFENCTFVGNGKSGYNGANLWGSAKLINCEFTFNGTTTNEWIDCIGADKTYEFVNCTVNGVAYTAGNYTNFDEIFSRNNVTVKIDDVDCAM